MLWPANLPAIRFIRLGVPRSAASYHNSHAPSNPAVNPMRAAPIASLLIFAGAALAQPKSREVPVTGEAQLKLAAIDRLMLDYLAREKAPGAAVAVTKDGRLVYARGFGWAEPEHKSPVQPASLFRIASVSKAITAAAICQLVERGQLKNATRSGNSSNLKNRRIWTNAGSGSRSATCSTTPEASTAARMATRCSARLRSPRR